MIGTIISLLSGALGGVGAGKLMPNSSLGTLWNAVSGIAGGGIGGTIISMLTGATASGAMDPMSILTNVAGGGVGGGIVMAVIGLIKKAMAK